MPRNVARTRSSRPRAQASRSTSTGSPRPRATGGPGKAQPGMLRAAGSAVGQALRKSTEVVAEAGSGLVNTARGVIPRAVTGQHDAVSVLKSHHRQVEGLFEQVLSSEDARTRKELMQTIADLLAMHTKIEEDIFYPAVRSLGTDAIEDLVDEAFEEHHVVDLVLAELPLVSARDDRFAAKMTVLSELVEHHVKEEERDMFKRAQGLGADRLKELGVWLEEAAARYLSERRRPNGGARSS